MGRRVGRRERSDSCGTDCRRGGRRAAPRQLHRVFRRWRVAFGDSGWAGVGRDQRAGRVRGADRGGHGAGAGDFERGASARISTSRPFASRESTSSSRTGARSSHRPGSMRRRAVASKRPSMRWSHPPSGRKRCRATDGSIDISPARVRTVRRRRGHAGAGHSDEVRH